MSDIETRQEAFLKALSSAGISPEYQGDGVFTGQSRLFEMVFDAACSWQARAQSDGGAVPDWEHRQTDTHAGWVNELLTLADHHEKIPGFARNAMQTIARGLLSVTPQQPNAVVPEGWRVLPEDLETHLWDFKAAVHHMIECNGGDTEGYWSHQAKTLENIEKMIVSAPQLPSAAVPQVATERRYFSAQSWHESAPQLPKREQES